MKSTTRMLAIISLAIFAGGATMHVTAPQADAAPKKPSKKTKKGGKKGTKNVAGLGLGSGR